MDLKKYYPQMIQTIQNAVRIKTVLDKPVLGGPFGQGNKDCLEYVLSVAKNMGFRTVNLDGYCGYAEIGEGDELVGIVSTSFPKGTDGNIPPTPAHSKKARFGAEALWTTRALR